jgi:hypothetical protein
MITKAEIYKSLLRGEPMAYDPTVLAHCHTQLTSYEEAPFMGRGRRLNRFCLGADPEFMLTDPATGEAVHAVGLGLKPGLAFGADQNDRLVELRPAPSRSAVEVVASVMSELHWMYVLNPGSRSFDWVSPPFLNRDGIGGHVHFGRKQPTRAEEVNALDGVAHTFLRSKWFDTKLWKARQQGDAHGQRYGMLGDFRLQKHGYEYRTYPSWLHSPKAAYMTVVLSKLAVIDPSITTHWMKRNESPEMLFLMLTRYYKGRDDDAWILHQLLGRKDDSLVYRPGDFKPAWGLLGNEAEKVSKPRVDNIPQSIEPTVGDIENLTRHLLTGSPIEFNSKQMTPNWRHLLPKGYFAAMTTFSPGRAPGVGDVFAEVVVQAKKDLNPTIAMDGDNLSVFVPPTYRYAKKLKTLIRSELGSGSVEVVRDKVQWHVRVGRLCRNSPANCAKTKAILLSGLLPFWKADDVQEHSASEFHKHTTGKSFDLKTYFKD